MDELFLLHTHYIPPGLAGSKTKISAVIIPEFYPDLNLTYIDSMAYFSSVEEYIFYVEKMNPFKCDVFYSIENLNVITGIDQLALLKGHGLRIIQLFHGKSNAYFSIKDGLSDSGISLIKEIEKLDMVLDLSHIPETCLDEIVAAFSGRTTVSHCACSELYAGKAARSNSLSAASIKNLARLGTVFGVAFVNDIAASNVSVEISTESLFEDIVAQILMFFDLAGPKQVALGPDYFDCDYFSRLYQTRLYFPADMCSLSGYAKLYTTLREKGLTLSNVNNIFFSNAKAIVRDGRR